MAVCYAACWTHLNQLNFKKSCNEDEQSWSTSESEATNLNLLQGEEIGHYHHH